MKKVSASAPVMGGKQYHIDCGPGDVAPYLITPGDPARVPLIAQSWDNYKEVAYHREYRTVTGKIKGTAISCTSAGVGAPSFSVMLEELMRIGVHTFIRAGTTGGIQRDQKLGDLVISTGAVRFEGASRDYVTIEYPAVANYEVVMALIEAVEKLKFRYHLGITASTDTFYTGQGRPGYNNYLPSFKENIYKDMQKAGVENFEMEASCLFTMAGLFNKRAGAVCTIIANRVTDEFKITDEYQKRAGLVATEAIRILAGWDKIKKRKNKKYLYPDLIK